MKNSFRRSLSWSPDKQQQAQHQEECRRGWGLRRKSNNKMLSEMDRTNSLSSNNSCASNGGSSCYVSAAEEDFELLANNNLSSPPPSSIDILTPTRKQQNQKVNNYLESTKESNRPVRAVSILGGSFTRLAEEQENGDDCHLAAPKSDSSPKSNVDDLEPVKPVKACRRLVERKRNSSRKAAGVPFKNSSSSSRNFFRRQSSTLESSSEEIKPRSKNRDDNDVAQEGQQKTLKEPTSSSTTNKAVGTMNSSSPQPPEEEIPMTIMLPFCVNDNAGGYGGGGGGILSYGSTCEDDENRCYYITRSLTPTQQEMAALCTYKYFAERDTMTDDDVYLYRREALYAMARRYYISYNEDTRKAREMMEATLTHRLKNDVNSFRTCFYDAASTTPKAKENQRLVRKYLGPKGRMFVRGYDKEDRAVFHFIGQNSPLEGKNDPEGCIEAHYYILEKAIACSERKSNGKQSQIVVSVDFTNFAKWHAPPLNVVQYMLVMLNDHYPERLAKVYLVNAPLVSRFMWSFIQPLLDPATKEKFMFVTGDAQRREVFGANFEADQCMPYQRPDGTMTEPVDMEEFYKIPFDQVYGEERLSSQ